jgi:hypothetical protein
MGLKLAIIPFIKFFTLMSPLLISSFTLLQSAFNSNIKGVIFLLGAAIIMFLGNLISSTLPSRVPSGYDAACNIIDTDAMGWGTYYSSPGPHQLFLWYAATYICTGMFVNGLVNWSLFGLFVTLIIASGVLRYWQLRCVNSIDIVLGTVGGLTWGLLWYFIVSSVENSYDPQLDLTYFNTYSDGEQCKLGPKAFRCRKLKKS